MKKFKERHKHSIEFGKDKSFYCKKCKRKVDCTKLNIGAGNSTQKIQEFKNWVNLDILHFPNVDVIHNLNSYPWPFPDNAFKVVHASHIIEHLDVDKALNEIVRIVKPGGFIQIRVPHHSSPFKRLSHTYEGWNLETFSQHYREASAYSDLYLEQKQVKFIIFSAKRYMEAKRGKVLNWFINLNWMKRIYERFFSYILPSVEIHYLLKVHKK